MRRPKWKLTIEKDLTDAFGDTLTFPVGRDASLTVKTSALLPVVVDALDEVTPPGRGRRAVIDRKARAVIFELRHVVGPVLVRGGLQAAFEMAVNAVGFDHGKAEGCQAAANETIKRNVDALKVAISSGLSHLRKGRGRPGKDDPQEAAVRRRAGEFLRPHYERLSEGAKRSPKRRGRRAETPKREAGRALRELAAELLDGRSPLRAAVDDLKDAELRDHLRGLAKGKVPTVARRLDERLRIGMTGTLTAHVVYSRLAARGVTEAGTTRAKFAAAYRDEWSRMCGEDEALKGLPPWVRSKIEDRLTARGITRTTTTVEGRTRKTTTRKWLAAFREERDALLAGTNLAAF